MIVLVVLTTVTVILVIIFYHRRKKSYAGTQGIGNDTTAIITEWAIKKHFYSKIMFFMKWTHNMSMCVLRRISVPSRTLMRR